MRLARDSLTVGERIEILGTVQGVGFRPWVFGVARQMGIAGRVRNDPAGVVIEAFGDSGSLQRFRETLREAPSPARIQTLRYRPIPAEATDGFSIAPSTAAAPRRVSIPPDLAICSRCAAEIADPGDRRFIYPFTNCTACGPRFTIATDVPYDRASTTMAPFHLCGECAREYADPSDRRFHAEPNGCPRCGPRLSALDVTGREIVTGPIAEAALAIREGAIVAVKGIGGFHLACDASSPQAVLRLRERKRREEKPFAVMVRDLQEARRIAWLGPEEERLLASPEAPIVLARRRAGSGIAAEVAPRNPLIGVLLPYAPPNVGPTAAVEAAQDEMRQSGYDTDGDGLPSDFLVAKPAVSPDYFRVMGIRLLNGRGFTEQDNSGAPGVAIVSKSVARTLWPGENPVGMRITMEDNPKPKDWLTIVGVVDDVRQQRLTDQPQPAIYQPYQQVTRPFFLSHMSFVIRTAAKPQSVAAAMRGALHDVDKNQPVSIAAMTDLSDAATAETWFQTRLISIFSLLALFLAAIGIYGVLAFAVTERTREIGIRMALGAQKGDITRMLLNRSLGLVMVGLLLGGCGALLLTRVLAKLLFEVKPTDPSTFLSVAAILAATGIIAGLLPAYRATRVDPVVALRWE